jgi:CO/xanthine dehydrogenase FAD-binding subunit
MHHFAYHAPCDWGELLSLRETEGSSVVAGGTDLLPLIHARQLEPRLLIDLQEASGPSGAKGSGEQSTVATASAIVNAIAEATAVRVTRLPVEPEDLVRRTTPPG